MDTTPAQPTGVLRLGGEAPAPARGCRTEPCDARRVGPVDLYCADHEQLIPLSAARFGKARWFMVNLARAAACGAVVLAALLETPLPLFVLLCVAGLVVGVVPLYRFPFTAKAVAVVWVLACVAVQVLPLLPDLVQRITHTALIGVLLVVAVVHTGQLAWFARRRAGLSTAPAVVYAAFSIAPAFLVGWVLARPDVGVVLLWDWVRDWLLVAAVTGAAGSLLVAAIAGAIDGQSRVDTRVRPVVRARATAWSVDWRVEPRPANGAKGFDRALNEFSGRAAASVVAAARGAANLLLRAAHLLQVLGVRMTNWGHRRAVMGQRRTVAAVAATGGVLSESAGLGLWTGPRTLRAVVLPALLVAVAAGVAVAGSETALAYLLTDHLPLLLDIAAAAAVGIGALTVLWMSVSGLAPTLTAVSWLRSAAIAIPHAVVLLTLGAWVIGLPGTLGYGPVTLGPLTLTATALLVATFAWTRWSPKARSRAPRPAPRPAARGNAIGGR